MAEPCVTATFDAPLPGAEDVITKQVDVPSPQFPGIWQEGVIDGFFYALYANGEGVLRPSRKSTDWQIAIQCNEGLENCAFADTGAPTAEAIKTATFLAACLQGLETPTPEVTPVIEAPTIAPTPTEPCGKETIPEGDNGITLQRLLVAAGGDPGPIDGYPGELTQTALVAILGEEARSIEVAKAIAALDAYLCKE